MGGSYLNWFNPVKIRELVRFDRAPIINGYNDDATGDLYCCWGETSSAFGPVFKEVMSYTWILKITRVYKLNNNLITTNKGQVGY